jgi:hypothetical protein
VPPSINSMPSTTSCIMKRPYPRGAPCGGGLTHSGGLKPRPWCRISAMSRLPSNQQSTDRIGPPPCSTQLASASPAPSSKPIKSSPESQFAANPAISLRASLAPEAEQGKRRLNCGVRLKRSQCVGCGPESARISMMVSLSACASFTAAEPTVLGGGQVTSFETHPCHFTRIVEPNEALFAHDPLATLSLRAAARSVKKRSTMAFGTVKGLGLDVPDVIDAEPSALTTIWFARELVEPESTMTALSTGTAPTRTTAA